MSDSPFLPNTQHQYAWDSTSLGLLKTCPRLYQYVMLEGYQSPEESVHLRFGIEVHTAIQDYDILRAKGISFDDALRTVVGDIMVRTHGWSPDRDTKAGKYKNRDTLLSCVIDYFDHYRNDPAKTFILADGRPAVELSFSFELNFGPTADQPYLLCGHLDRVADFNGDLFVIDHKTSTTTLGGYFFDQFQPNNQMTLYTIGGKVVLNSPIRGVIIDGIQILLEDQNRFIRGTTYRTEDQLEEWQHDLEILLMMARAYAEVGYWPMNDTACDKFGGCKFREVCSASPGVRHVYLNKFTKLAPEDRWNPLKAR